MSRGSWPSSGVESHPSAQIDCGSVKLFFPAQELYDKRPHDTVLWLLSRRKAYLVVQQLAIGGAMSQLNNSMHAMVLDEPGQALHMRCLPRPQPGADQLLVKIAACAVCRTDLHVVDGELPKPKLPIIPGHEIVGRVVSCGANVRNFSIGERIGIPWLGWTCGQCGYCRSGHENLCADAKFTGYQIDGGYAEWQKQGAPTQTLEERKAAAK